MLRHLPASSRQRVVVLLTAIVLLGLLAVVIVTTGRSPDEPTAGAAPTPPPPTSATTVAPPTSEPTTTEESTTSTAPTETSEPAPPATLPPANPGPPVWPSTGAQARPGHSVTIYSAMNGPAIRTLTDPFGPLPSHPGFRVLETRGSWMRVSLPLRPNESTGWIQRDDVTLFTTNMSIDVDLNAHWITVYDKDNVVASRPVVVGTAWTPTPTGNFFITDLIANPGGPFGSYAFGLSGRSRVLNEFAGGDGQIAIHGTNQPGLMGTASSHGCVRVTNDVATFISKSATIGVPVHIHAG